MKLSDGLRTVFLAGVGAVAVTGEKAKKLVDDLVKKGELTVEEGKVLNEDITRKMGEKTAVKLLQQYGSLEDVLSHAGEIKGKLGEKIRDNADLARKCKALATIHRDAPVEFRLSDCAMPDLMQGIPALKKLQLNQLIRRITGQGAPNPVQNMMQPAAAEEKAAEEAATVVGKAAKTAGDAIFKKENAEAEAECEEAAAECEEPAAECEACEKAEEVLDAAVNEAEEIAAEAEACAEEACDAVKEAVEEIVSEDKDEA